MKKENLKNLSKNNKFIEKICEIYPKSYEEILNFHKTKMLITFRFTAKSTNRKSILEELENSGYKFKESSIKNSYILLESLQPLSMSKAFTDGYIHIQQLSSMIPAMILDPKSGEKVLDLCAAPGSKTSQMYDLSKGKSEIIANEVNKKRIYKLQDVLETQGIDNIEIINYDGVTLPFKRPDFNNYFDKILLDAPCTNEAGIDLNSPDSLKYWKEGNASKLSKIQKGLMNSAIKMLKLGGTLVYSTCTYSVEENELVLDWILKRYPTLEISKLKIQIPNSIEGKTEYRGKWINDKIKNAMRIVPNEYFEAFFVAKIIKH